MLIPGLLAAGIGSLVSIGIGSWTGVDTSEISIGVLSLPDFARPDLADFAWTIPLAAVDRRCSSSSSSSIGRRIVPLASARPFVVLPAVGIAVAALAIVFSQATDKGVHQVLFSGQEALSPLVANPGGLVDRGAARCVIGCKALAYGLSLGSFRGGPVFPALFLGGAAGVLVADLPGFALTPAVAVGIGAATVAVLRLPLSAVVLAFVLTSQSGPGAAPLIIVGVVVAYLVTLALPSPPGTGAPDRR